MVGDKCMDMYHSISFGGMRKKIFGSNAEGNCDDGKDRKKHGNK